MEIHVGGEFNSIFGPENLFKHRGPSHYDFMYFMTSCTVLHACTCGYSCGEQADSGEVRGAVDG